VLTTDTAFTAPAGPGPVRDIAIEALMAESLSWLAARVPGPDPTRLPPSRGGLSDLGRAVGD
jgi:hypothetical protein